MKIENGRCLYVVYNHDNGLVKIGVSENPAQRKHSLELASGCNLDLVYNSKHLICAEKYETDIHRHFISQNIKGEWFKITIEEAIAAIDNAIKDATEDKIVEEYKKGYSITNIAKENEVTRQAILAKLKKYGIYDKKGDVYEKHHEYVPPKMPCNTTPTKPKLVTNIANINETDEAEMYLDAEKPPLPLKNLKRVEPNVYYNGEWYQANLFIGKEFFYAYSKSIDKVREYVRQRKTQK